MIEVECTARKIGNSIGITFPKDIVDRANIKENDVVKLLIDPSKEDPFKKNFGLLKGKVKTDLLLKETDFELWGIKK